MEKRTVDLTSIKLQVFKPNIYFARSEAGRTHNQIPQRLGCETPVKMKGKFHMIMMHLLFVLFAIFNLTYMLLRNIYWWISGRSAEIKEAQSNYATSGHKMGFYYKYILDLLAFMGKIHFGLYHEGFVHPEYVLRDNVTLMYVTPTEAVFMEQKDGSEPAHSSLYSFLINGQYLMASKIICMPLKSMLRLADEMGEYNPKLIFIYNQSRCGSTLLTSIFEHTGRCVSFAEPHALNAICKQIDVDKRWNEEESRRLIQGTMKVLCKPFHGYQEKTLAYVIKPTGTCIATASKLADALPESKSIFIYRDPIAVGQSLRRLAEVIISLKMTYLLMRLGIPNACCNSLKSIGLVVTPFEGWTPKTHTDIEFGYYLCMVTVAYRDQLAKKGLNMPAIRFEDLRDHPKSMISQIIKVCDLPESLIPAALKAMDRDSQHAMEFSQDKLRKLMPELPQPTPEFIAERKMEAAKMGVPPPEMWTKDFRLDNSILP